MLSDYVIDEQACLVSRGVLPLPILELINREPKAMTDVHIRLNHHAGVNHEIISFVVHTSRDGAMAGFAAAPWVIDLLK